METLYLFIMWETTNKRGIDILKREHKIKMKNKINFELNYAY